MATLKAPNQVSHVEDAEKIKKACVGWGTDEKVIVSILAHRTATQRKLIRLAYEEIYQQDLIDQLQSELSGDFERVICSWVLDPPQRQAVLANQAIHKSKPDYRVIAEIACCDSAEDLLAVKRAYKYKYKRSLEEDVAAHTTGNIRKLLVALVSSFRYDGSEVNERLAYREATIVHDEIRSAAEYNLEEVIRVLCTRSKPQLIATFNHYKDISGTSITKSLKGEPANEFLAACRLVIRIIKNPIKHFEKVVRHAIAGLGTDEDALSRVIVTRAEKDLKEIKKLYFNKNNASLEKAVANDTSGDYRDFLLALLGAEESV
uniref:Annexin n=1 Tax=Kalanchoe fedtschenkoi TaxID=63787 RepID=A0A7N0THE9_KALFE